MTNHKIQCVYGVKESAEKPKEEKKAAPTSDKPALVNQIIDASVLKEKAETASKSKNSTTNSTNISVCDEYAWQGNIYYNSGVYIDTITNSFGCDSIMSLNLIINNSPNVVITQNNNILEAQSFGGAAPYGFIWNTGDTTMNIIPQVSGNYWVLSIDANGCVSDTSHLAVFIIASQIEEASSVKNLSKIVNSLGQPLKPVNNMPLFYIYDDGTVEKKIIIE